MSDEYSQYEYPQSELAKMRKGKPIEVTREHALADLQQIPGVGKSIARDLWNIGVKKVSDLKGRDPQELYDLSNRFAGVVQDPCLLYTFRCAVYFASTPERKRNPEKLKWWNWKETTSSKKKKARP